MSGLVSPSIFISHGSPMLAIETGPTQSFLSDLGENLGRPDAILIVSAHWETETPQLGNARQPETIYDFSGFPAALNEMRYPAGGAPQVAGDGAALLRAAGFAAGLEDRGLDHGAWVPLSLMYPAANIPVTQMSIQPSQSPEYHARLGEALRPLRAEGVMVISSGSLTHNLGLVRGRDVNAPIDPRAAAFATWIKQAVESGDREQLYAYRGQAPFADVCHPTDEHLLPLFVAVGAGEHRPGRQIHSGVIYGALSMDAYIFD